MHPKVPFYFYLDPGAGMNRIYTAAGEVALVEIVDTDPQFHYTWQTTIAYRRRFGQWNYHTDYGTRVSLVRRTRDRFCTSDRNGLTILSESGDWIEVPQHLADIGMAQLSALIYPIPSTDSWISASKLDKIGLTVEPEMIEEERLRILSTHLQGEIGEAPPRFAQLGELLGEKTLEKIKRILPLMYPDWIPNRKLFPELDLYGWLFPTEAGFWDWPDSEWLNEVRDVGVEDTLITPVLEYAEWQFQLSWLQMSEALLKRIKPNSTLRQRVNVQIALEHTRQFASLLEAFNRFAYEVRLMQN